MISKRSVFSSVTRYRVQPSARVINFAAVRMLSSRRLMSRSADSEAPIAFRRSRRWARSSPSCAAASSRKPWVSSTDEPLMGARAPPSLDTDRTDFLHVGHARQALLHPVLLERAHALLQRHRDQLRHARLLGDELLQRVRR